MSRLLRLRHPRSPSSYFRPCRRQVRPIGVRYQLPGLSERMVIMKEVLCAAVAVMALHSVEADAQAGRNWLQGFIGPGGCQSIEAYAGLSPTCGWSRDLDTRTLMEDNE
jgi:hypothetical protein